MRHLTRRTKRHDRMIEGIRFLHGDKSPKYSPLGPTTAELQSWTGDMSPATTISECRKLLEGTGYTIVHTCMGKNEKGKMIHRYAYKKRD